MAALQLPAVQTPTMHRSHSLLSLPQAANGWLQLATNSTIALPQDISHGTFTHNSKQGWIDKGLIDDRGGNYEKYRMSDEDIKRIKTKSVRQFYTDQNDVLDMFKEVDDILDDCVGLSTHLAEHDLERSPLLPKSHLEKGSTNDESSSDKRVLLAIQVNMAINVVLLAAKIFVVVLTNSVSLIASTIDSAMDLVSTLIIFFTSRWIAHSDEDTSYNYPTGKRRLEPIGIIVFSVFMQASFIQVLIESIQRLADERQGTVSITKVGLIIMISTIFIKLVVWFAYRGFKNSSVRALAQDAENDVVFNFFSLLFPVVGTAISWGRMDALGGVILSLYIIIYWGFTLYQQVVNLAGRRASPAAHQRVIYLVTRFSPLVRQIQHVSVYSAGDNQIIETDIIVPADTPLPIAHNVGESIQMAL